MKSRRQFMSLLAAALALPAAWSPAGVLTCPKCNYEIEAGQTACPHCEAPLLPAPARPEAPVAEPPATPVRSGRLGAEAARQMESLARQAAERGEVAEALILTRQAAGLALAAGATDRIGSLDQLDRTLGDALRLGTQRCVVCNGKGNRLTLYANFAGDINEQVVPNLRCPACGGDGTLRKVTTVERMQARMGEGQRDADTLLRSLHYTDLGGIWVPQDRADSLTPAELAALRGVVGRRCATCMGSGVFGCETCSGSGRAKCSGEGCVMGAAPCPECKGKRRISVTENKRTVQQSCRACKQTGVVNCPICAGRGWQPCLKCKGRGEQNCSVCQGKGQPAVCAKCTGRGLMECRNCKGTGEFRGAPCLVCKGGKEMLCPTCNGSGRKKR